MLVTKDEITSLIPQRAPIIMIDSLVKQEEDYTLSEFMIEEDNIFIKNGELMTEGMLENIAQTSAARAGYAYHLKNMRPPLGFIGAITKVKAHNSPKIGQLLSSKVTIKSEIFNVTLIRGEVFVNGTLQCECEMKIVLADE